MSQTLQECFHLSVGKGSTIGFNCPRSEGVLAGELRSFPLAPRQIGVEFLGRKQASVGRPKVKQDLSLGIAGNKGGA